MALTHRICPLKADTYIEARTPPAPSDDGNRHYCAADTRYGVRMVNQRSGRSLQTGATVGARPAGIWSDRGCRADVIVGSFTDTVPGGPPPPPLTIAGRRVDYLLIRQLGRQLLPADTTLRCGNLSTK